MDATITSVDQTADKIVVTVSFVNEKDTQSKEYTYTKSNLDSKQQVLDMIQAELQDMQAFQSVVDDLKTEIDRPIQAQAQAEVVSE